MIDTSDYIDESEKKDNISLLRAQLSTYEQIILFLNSLSSLGRTWELEDEHDSTKHIPYKLITKYKLIKNILSDDIDFNISISEYYPFYNDKSEAQE